ncbi:MAG: hypothetical protein IJF41_04015 [Clostridia bacterium]|nr:hypothetical protein [Clostridia bacterium]
MKKEPRSSRIIRETEAYFAFCDSTRERVEGKNGQVSFRQTPYTLAGLAERTGLDKETIRDMAQNGSPRSGVVRCLRGALRRIERYTVEHALLGELQLSVAQMLLSDLGCGTRLPEAATGEGIVVRLEDPKGWGE